MQLNELKTEIIKGLIKQKCFVFEDRVFMSSGGFKVPFFIDVRRLFSDPKMLDLVAEFFTEKIKKSNIKWIAGAETAGIPFSTATSIKSGLNMFYIRKKQQDHGMESFLAGLLPEKGERVVVIDDSVGGMGSIKIFVENLKKEGYNPELFLYVLEMDIWGNSEERNKEFFEKEGVSFDYIVNWKEWIEFMRKEKIMSDMLADVCLEASKNPLLFAEDGKLEWYQKEKESGNIWFNI